MSTMTTRKKDGHGSTESGLRDQRKVDGAAVVSHDADIKPFEGATDLVARNLGEPGREIADGGLSTFALDSDLHLSPVLGSEVSDDRAPIDVVVGGRVAAAHARSNPGKTVMVGSGHPVRKHAGAEDTPDHAATEGKGPPKKTSGNKYVGRKKALQTKRTEFGQRLFDARKRAGLDQTEVARILQISQTTLGELETRSHSSSFVTVAALAHLYDVDPHYLATGRSGNPQLNLTTGISADVLSPWAKRLGRLLDRVPAPLREAAFWMCYGQLEEVLYSRASERKTTPKPELPEDE